MILYLWLKLEAAGVTALYSGAFISGAGLGVGVGGTLPIQIGSE
jgi:hypothetical protein